MLRAWRIGRLAGIDVYVHWSLLLLPFLLERFSSFDRALKSGVSELGFLMVFVPLVFLCVLLHEFGHALMARRYGIETADITLYPLGGVARLTDRSEGGGLGAGPPEQELWIALAGPAVNVVIAFAMGLVQLVVPFDPHTFAGEMAGFVLFGNIALVMFNMLPFFPMDGGRVFRAWLAMQIGQLRATEAATTLGFFMALGLAVLGACSGNLMLVLISGVIYLLGRQELAVLRVRQGQEQAAMAAHQVRTLAVDASARPPSADFSGFTFDQRHRMWVYWQGGRPIQGYALE